MMIRLKTSSDVIVKLGGLTTGDFL